MLTNEPIPAPKCYLSDGGTVYFLHQDALLYAPVMLDGTFGLDEASPVGFNDGISEENQAYCKSIETALYLLVKRNLAEGMPVNTVAAA